MDYTEINLAMYPNLKWARIKDYFGYEFCAEYNLVRSFKNPYANEYGKILKAGKDANGYFYTLSDMHNERKKVYVKEIRELCKDQPVVSTCTVNLGATRNVLTRRPMKGVETFIPTFESLLVKGEDR